MVCVAVLVPSAVQFTVLGGRGERASLGAEEPRANKKHPQHESSSAGQQDEQCCNTGCRNISMRQGVE